MSVTATSANSVDQVLEARWVIPVEPHGVVFEHHAVVLAGDKIVELLPIEAARAKYTNAKRIDLPEHALIPGLINAHTHNPMTLMRGLADDLPLMTWLQQHIWPAEATVISPEFVRDGVELAIAEMLRGGTTCCNENYFFPDIQAATYLRHGFRAVVGLPFVEFPSAWAKSRDEYFDKNLAVHDEFKGEALISTTLAPHAPYTVADESFVRIRVLSDLLDLPVHIHVHETAQEVEDSRTQYGLRPLARMQALGMVNDHLIAVHMTQLTDAEIAACAEAGVSVVHCAESNLKLASGFCPAEKLRRAGVNLALGTDGCASNNDLDMFGEMRTAALLAKGVANDASAFDAAFALQAATLNSARALGLGNHIGSLVAGKQADLTAIRLDALETQPLYNAISQLVYATGRHQVSDVWIAGVRKLENGTLPGIDVDDLRDRARMWHARIAE
jgi:5-methylthioadenosine/S-adenosylhomocysteine deaminase